MRDQYYAGKLTASLHNSRLSKFTDVGVPVPEFPRLEKVSCRGVEAFFCRPYWFFANQGGVDFRPPMIGPFPYGD